LWTRKQRFMQMFARNNNRVLYVETPVHLLGLDVLPHDPGRFFRFLRHPRKIEKNLYVATLPILLPFFQMSSLINRINQAIVRRVIQKWMNYLRFKDVLLWVYAPFSAPLAAQLKSSAVIYECVDEFRAAKGFVLSSVVGEMEEALLKSADVCIVTQESLLLRRTNLCKNTFCVPNGADTELFQAVSESVQSDPEIMKGISPPRIGFVGHIQYWVDLKLIRYIADLHPEWNIILIGPIHPLADRSYLSGAKNIHLLGRQPQSQIPYLLNAMDVCVNPYKVDAVANHASPLKLYEYLAAGKPVVSTDMPEARKFPEDVRVAGSYDQFVKLCDEVLANLPETEIEVRRRKIRVALHSWPNRFARVNEILCGSLAR